MRNEKREEKRKEITYRNEVIKNPRTIFWDFFIIDGLFISSRS